MDKKLMVQPKELGKRLKWLARKATGTNFGGLSEETTYFYEEAVDEYLDNLRQEAEEFAALEQKASQDESVG